MQLDYMERTGGPSFIGDGADTWVAVTGALASDSGSIAEWLE
jgi:hypothetical protein